MKKLQNYVLGRWIAGEGEGQPLFDSVNGQPIAEAGTGGIDFSAVLQYARTTGNPALRKMTFHERGRMLKALALHLQERVEKFYALSYSTGATKADSWVDIEGGIGNLFSYASLRRKFPDEPFAVDGPPISLSKNGQFGARHLLIPKEGVAVHINAFNFPVWGMLEKIAVNLLAGVPALVKPATITSYLTEAVTREIVESGILPEGALQLVCGPARDLLDHVNAQDVITFTGSAVTGLHLKTSKSVVDHNVPFNLEADSLNCIVLGESVTPGTPEWEIFIKEIRKEMTSKAGQKCTAIRRIFVPENRLEAVSKDLAASLKATTIGNPRNEKVRMGSLAGKSQRQEVRQQVEKLMRTSQLIYGDMETVELIDADAGTGAFMSPLLLLNEHPFGSAEPHEVEAFGPVSTLMPYKNFDEAIDLSRKGKGSLVSTIVTHDHQEAGAYIWGAGTHHGRMLILNRECAKENTGHGSPLPSLVHGGPGRAGGGEEMGGERGVRHYMQRVAVQGSPGFLTAVSGDYHAGANTREDDKHPFRKYYDELQIGDTLVTGKRTVTEADIVNFANVSWDHFYAHVDHSSIEDSLFEKPVAHGYFILSAAAGLFVDGKKGPVLLNYGIEECKFMKPVYAGTTIGVRLTCRQKIPQDLKDENDIPRGIVKWLVEITDDSQELVAIATILTMVRRKP